MNGLIMLVDKVGCNNGNDIFHKATQTRYNNNQNDNDNNTDTSL